MNKEQKLAVLQQALNNYNENGDKSLNIRSIVTRLSLYLLDNNVIAYGSDYEHCFKKNNCWGKYLVIENVGVFAIKRTCDGLKARQIIKF